MNTRKLTGMAILYAVLGAYVGGFSAGMALILLGASFAAASIVGATIALSIGLYYIARPVDDSAWGNRYRLHDEGVE